MNIVRSALAAITARLDLSTAEAREGVTAIEAAAVDDFEQQLIAITGDDSLARAELREMAIKLGQAGIRPDEIEAMAQTYHWFQMLGLTGPDIRSLGQTVMAIVARQSA